MNFWDDVGDFQCVMISVVIWNDSFQIAIEFHSCCSAFLLLLLSLVGASMRLTHKTMTGISSISRFRLSHTKSVGSTSNNVIIFIMAFVLILTPSFKRKSYFSSNIIAYKTNNNHAYTMTTASVARMRNFLLTKSIFIEKWLIYHQHRSHEPAHFKRESRVNRRCRRHSLLFQPKIKSHNGVHFIRQNWFVRILSSLLLSLFLVCRSFVNINWMLPVDSSLW